MSLRRIADAIGLREGEGARTLRLFGLILLLTMAFVFAKAAQQGLFLGAYPRSKIPDAFIFSAITLAAMSFLASAVAARLGPTRLLFVLLAMAGGMFVLARLFLLWGLPAAPMVIYVVVEVVIGLLLVQAWAVVSETLDIRSAKRLLPLVGNAAGIGWTIGGFAARPLSAWLGAAALLLISAALMVGCFVIVRLIVRFDLGGRPATGKRGTTLLDGARAGVRFVIAVPLLRALAVITVAGLLVEQVLDYQLFAAAQARYAHDSDAIAAFMGTFFGVTGIITLLATSTFSGRILTRFGSAPATLVAPGVALIGALLFVVHPAFLVVVATRGGYRVLKQSLSSPARAQMQTTLSPIRRAQAGALLKGVLAPAFYALGGVMLKLLPATTDIRWLSLPAAAIALIGVIAAWWHLRPAYFAGLRRSVEQQRIDLDAGRRISIDGEQVKLLIEQAADPDPERAVFAVYLLADSDPKIARAPLSEACSHPSPQVQAAALDALSDIGDHDDAAIAAATLEQTDNDDVERAALCALANLGLADAEAAVRKRCDDDAPFVRALARACMIPRGGQQSADAVDAFMRMLTSASPEDRVAAAWAMGETQLQHPELREAFALMIHDDALEVRNQALCSAGSLGEPALIRDVVLAFGDQATSAAAFTAFAAAGDDMVPAVGEALDGTSEVVHSRTAAALAASSGPNGDALLARLLVDERKVVRYRAARALVARQRSDRWWPPPKQTVRDAIKTELRIGYGYYALLAGVARTDGVEDWDIEPEFEFIAAELRLRIRQTEKRLFSLLALLVDPKLVATAEAQIRRKGARKAAAAVELLEHALDREVRRLVVPFLDTRSLRLRLREPGADLPIRAEYLDDPLAGIMTLDDPHLHRCAMLCYGDKMEAEYPEALRKLEPMLPLIKRIRFLRRVPLFQELSGEDLMQVAKIAGAMDMCTGEVIFHKGDPGDELYLIVAGCVSVQDGGKEIASIGVNEFFGELAVLDDEPRSASIVCSEDTELLHISQPDLEELMERRPQIAREIIRVLTRRLRRSTQRISND